MEQKTKFFSFSACVKSFLLLLFVAQFSFSVFAQDKGLVKFQIDNENGYFEVLVNDTLLIKKYKDSLAVGTYQAKVWSPGYDVEDFEFIVEKDQETVVYVQLLRSTAYGAYSQSYKNYRMKFHKAITVPVSTTLALGITSGILMIKGYDLQNQIKLGIESYQQSSLPNEIRDIKESVALDNQKYNRTRTGFYVFSGLTLLGVASTTYFAIKFKRNNIEPVYSKESPFADKVSLQFNPYGCALTIKIG